MEKGIQVHDLFNSDVFIKVFDVDEWPGTHINEEEVSRSYNKSYYHLDNNYETVFPEENFSKILMEEKDLDFGKVFKIKYSINLLP